MKLQVKSLSGEARAVEVAAEGSVEEARLAVARQFNLRPEQVKLLHKSKTLEDGKPLESYAISEADSIVLVALKVD